IINIKRRAEITQATPPLPARRGGGKKIPEAPGPTVPAVKAEDGCIEYSLTIDAEGMGSFQTKYGADTFVFVEKWRDAAALKAHAAAPHMAAYAAKVKDLIATRVIHVMAPADK